MISEFWIFVLCGALLIGLTIGGFAVWLKGFFGAFVRVKASRGVKVFVRLVDKNGVFYKSAEVVEGMLIFKDNDKETRRIPLTRNVLYRSLNMNCVDIDSETNQFITQTGSTIGVFDAKKFDHLIKRALYKPNPEDKKLLIILALVVIILLAVGFIGFKVVSLEGVVTQSLQGGGPVI